jgi:hypothetical protein
VLVSRYNLSRWQEFYGRRPGMPQLFSYELEIHKLVVPGSNKAEKCHGMYLLLRVTTYINVPRKSYRE